VFVVNPVNTIGDVDVLASTKLPPFNEYMYVLMGEPLDDPATNGIVAVVVVVVEMVPIVGAAGALYTGTNSLGAEGGELPTSFTAINETL
jgi:hypothetical protein